MKERIGIFFRQCLDTLRLCPAEALLGLFFFAYGALAVEEAVIVKGREAYLALYPLFFCASMLLNRWTARGGAVRWIYYASPLLAVPFLWVDVQDWVPSIAYRITLALCPLMVFVCRWRRENPGFVGDALHYLKNIVFAGLLSGAAFALAMAIYFSLRYIFPGVPWGDQDKIMLYAAMTAFMLLLPLIFLTFVRLQDDEFRPVRFVDIMMNWVVSPAVLVYTAILYVYFLKILFLWSLPQGGVAWMVFAFAIIAVLAKAYQPMMSGRRLYDWFYDRFQWISLPAIAMFWIGVGHRIGEYGLTRERVYLLVCGFVMTIVVLMFFSRRWGRYLYATTIAIVLLAVFTYVPGITAEDLGIRSQRSRLEETLVKLELLDENGKLRQEKQPDADSLRGADYVQVYEAFRYLSRQDDTVYLRRVCGMTTGYELNDKVLPDNVRNGYYRNVADASLRDVSFTVHSGEGPLEVAGFRYLHDIGYGNGDYGWQYTNDRDSLHIYRTGGELFFGESLDRILSDQLARTGLPADSLTRDRMEERKHDLLVYDRDGYRIVFGEFSLERDSLAMRLTDVTIRWVLGNE